MKNFFIRSISDENAKEIDKIGTKNKASHGAVINMILDYIRKNGIEFSKEVKITKKSK